MRQFAKLISEMEADAYQRGWNDAVAKIMAAAKEGLPAPASLPVPKPNTPPPFTSQYDTPIIDLVFQAVRDQPGMTGAEIIREVMKRDPTIPFKVADRTGRTSLSRLKKRAKIWQRSKKWYSAKEQTKE